MKKKIATGILCLCSLGLFAQEGQTYTIPATSCGSGMRTTKATFTPTSGANGIQRVRITFTPNKTSGSGGQEAWRTKQQENEHRLKNHDSRLAKLEEHDVRQDAETNSRLDRIERVVFAKNGQDANPRLQYSNNGYNDGNSGQYQYDNTDYSRQQYNQDGYNSNQWSRQQNTWNTNSNNQQRLDNDSRRERRNARILKGGLYFLGGVLIGTATGLIIHHNNMVNQQNTYVPPTPNPVTPPTTTTQPTSGTGGPGGHITIP